MLNEIQKRKIRDKVESRFTAIHFETLSPQIQYLVCNAALSVKVYLENLETLKAAKLHTVVKQIGMMMSHPCPQNPTVSENILTTDRLDLDEVLVKAGDGYIAIKSGIFDLLDDNDEEKVTQPEISQYVEYLVRDVMAKIDPVNAESQTQAKKLALPTVAASKLSATTDSDLEVEQRVRDANFRAFNQQSTVKVGFGSYFAATQGRVEYQPGMNFSVLAELYKIASNHGHQNFLDELDVSDLSTLRYYFRFLGVAGCEAKAIQMMENHGLSMAMGHGNEMVELVEISMFCWEPSRAFFESMFTHLPMHHIHLQKVTVFNSEGKLVLGQAPITQNMLMYFEELRDRSKAPLLSADGINIEAPAYYPFSSRYLKNFR